MIDFEHALAMLAQLALQSKARNLLQQERARIARDIHDDLGAGLTQLVLLGELAQNDLGDGSHKRLQIEQLCEKTRGLLNSMDEVVWAVNSRRDALREIPSCRPDVVLMDIYLPEMSGIECTARLKLLLPNTQILILTVAEEHDLVFRALEAGADGYLLKRIKPGDLRGAILEALSGGAPMSSEIARRVVESFRQKSRSRDATINLTSREEEVLVLLSRGFSNKEIADQIGVSIETVRSHLKRIY